MNIGIHHAKQWAYRNCYIPPNLRNKIILDWENLKIKSKEEQR